MNSTSFPSLSKMSRSAASLHQQLIQACDVRIQTSPLVWVVSREYLLYTRSFDFRSLPGAGKCQLSKYIRNVEHWL